MSQLPEDDTHELSLARLILLGILIIIGAYTFASFLLAFRSPRR